MPSLFYLKNKKKLTVFSQTRYLKIDYKIHILKLKFQLNKNIKKEALKKI